MGKIGNKNKTYPLNRLTRSINSKRKRNVQRMLLVSQNTTSEMSVKTQESIFKEKTQQEKKRGRQRKQQS